jgi:RNA polymerase sigma-70 factor (TIGR02960 family)
VNGRTLERAREGDERAFRELTDPYRRELQVHCYRILGSVQDAEDLLQETLLAAWRGLDGFEERASLRAWLYRIATNRCLNALRATRRRPHGIGDSRRPAPPSFPEPTRLAEPLWLEPYPDVLLDEIPDQAPGPEARYEAKEALSLAFVAGLQHLPPQQRAVLVLRDVHGFRAAEVADILGTSESAVNSALQRARQSLESRRTPDRERAPLPRSGRERHLVARFAEAYESADIKRVVELLTEDARVTMPPEPFEYQGHDAIAHFFDKLWGERVVRLVPTRANNQPAFGYYVRDPHAPIAHANGLLVLTLEGEHISVVTRFGDNGLLARFGLPQTLRE